MDRPRIGAAIFACLVLTAGCTALTDSATTDTPNPGETPQLPTDTATADTAAPSVTDTGTPADHTTQTVEPTPTAPPTQSVGSTPTATPGWSPPEHPNKPLENKLEAGVDNHVKALEVVGGTESGDGAYSSVELAVTANTSLESIDPAEHGTVDGEPFFIVYVNSDLVTESDSQFVRVDGPPIQRSSEVAFDANGTTTLTVPQAAFEAAGIEAGEVELMVLLFDEDKAYDDVYGVRRLNVTYAPSE